MVDQWLKVVVEKKAPEWAALQTLLLHLHAKDLLTGDDVQQGLLPTLEQLSVSPSPSTTPSSSLAPFSPLSFLPFSIRQDTKVDAPMAEVWLASLMGELMHAKVLSPTLLQTPPDQMVEDGIAASFAVAVLAHVKVRHPAPCPISREFCLHALRGSEHACSSRLMCTLMLIYTGEPRRRACQGAEGGGRP